MPPIIIDTNKNRLAVYWTEDRGRETKEPDWKPITVRNVDNPLLHSAFFPDLIILAIE